MKKLLFVPALILISLLIHAAHLAAEPTAAGKNVAGAAELFDKLLKISEKCASNVSYSMEVTYFVNAVKRSKKLTLYFKDPKNFRIDSTEGSVKTRTVVTGGEAWEYDEAANAVTKKDRAELDVINLKTVVERLKDTCDIAEGADGKDKVYTLTDKSTGYKTAFTVGAENGAFVKMLNSNEKGEAVTNAVFSGWKFEKIDVRLFKKPEGAKEIK